MCENCCSDIIQIMKCFALFSVFESLRFHRKRRLSKTGLKVETFENGDFRKRCVVVWTGENRDF